MKRTNEYSDVFYHRNGSDVLHRVRIDWDSESVRSACGVIKTNPSDSNIIEIGEFSENFIDWLFNSGRSVYALCSHCRDRDFP